MGRYTLLLLVAAVFGGSYLALNVLRTQTETQGRRSDAQAAVLARQLAESGQAMALSPITRLDGFANDGLFVSDRDYNGGRILFEAYDESLTPSSPNGQRIAIQVAGAFGGVTHRLASVYEFDPMDFPGPIWLDVPYALGTVHAGATVSGGDYGYEPQIDPRKFNGLDVSEFDLSFDGIKTQLATAGVPVGHWGATGGRRTGDLGGGVTTADDLYFAVSNAVDPAAGDVVVAGDRAVTGAETWGGPTSITHVQGALSVPGSLRGEGALVVEGDLDVDGTLDWDGLVIVRTTEDHVAIALDGAVTLDGALVVSQDAYPPGGHVDVSVYRQHNGNWSTPYGATTADPLSGRPAPWGVTDPWPFWNHVHKFDHPAAGDADAASRADGVVRFADAGDPQGAYLGLQELLDHLGSQDVQVELANVSGGHGHAVLEVEVDGHPAVQRGVTLGFADSPLAGPHKFRSVAFPARDLERLVLRPQSLRSLRQLWDTPGTPNCTYEPINQWPMCVGGDRGDRRGALTLRVRRGNGGAVLYESAVYWHLQDGPEYDDYLADVAAWKDAVTSGASPFGATLTVGPSVAVTYAQAPIAALADKVGFDGNEVVHISTESVVDTEGASPPPGGLESAGPSGE